MNQAASMPSTASSGTSARFDWLAGACALAIVAVVLFAFWPALGHPPRGDQWPFLIDMIRQESCGDLIRHSYSYNRTRVILPGDEALFRPLLFVYLSLMQCIGGTHFELSQAVGIALHLGVTLLLFGLLRLILRATTGNNRAATLAAALAALYFATTPAIMEQVIWAHLHPYLLTVLCVLGAILVLLVAGARGTLTRVQIFSLVALGAVACFTFEVALFLPFTLAFFAIAGWMPGNNSARHRIALALIFSLPALAYFLANALDLQIHPMESGGRAGAIHLMLEAASWKSLGNFFRFLDFSIAYPYIAGKPEAFTGTRLWVAEPTRLAAFASGTLLCIMAGLLFLGLRATRFLGQSARRAVLLAGGCALTWILAYAALVTIGRINPFSGDPAVMSTSSYHSYAPYLASMLLAGICIGCIVATARRKGVHPPRRWLVYAGVGLMLLAIGVRTGIVRSVNTQLAQIQSPLSSAVQAINETRARDPFATFRISPHVADRLEHFQGIPVLYVLFARSIDQCSGTYEILAEAPHVRHAGNDTPCYPVLVRPDSNYHYYYYRGEYYAMPFWFGFPDESKTVNNPYVVRAPTLAQAQREQPARLTRLLHDLRSGRFGYPREPEPVRLR
jgi:hypothetical protein